MKFAKSMFSRHVFGLKGKGNMLSPKLGDQLDCVSGIRYTVIGIGKPGTKITIQDEHGEYKAVDIRPESYDDLRQRYLNS